MSPFVSQEGNTRRRLQVIGGGSHYVTFVATIRNICGEEENVNQDWQIFELD